MLSPTCHSCQEPMQAVIKGELVELVELVIEHTQEHGHTQPREHVLARVRRGNKK